MCPSASQPLKTANQLILSAAHQRLAGNVNRQGSGPQGRYNKEVTHETAIVWLRRDLRIADNPAFARALGEADHVVPVFVVNEQLWTGPGANRARFLATCLEDLQTSLNGRLVIKSGEPTKVLADIAKRTNASLLVRAGDVSPYAATRDDQVGKAMRAVKVETLIADWPWAVAPGTLATKSGTPFKVFTPYFRAWLQVVMQAPTVGPTVKEIVAAAHHELESDDPPKMPASDSALPTGGETQAHRVWESFLQSNLQSYDDGRDNPAADSTSRLSPYLKFGCIHPRQLLARLDLNLDAHRTFASELAWRDFYATVLHHWPHSAWTDWKDDLANIELNTGPTADEQFDLWCRGQTGYPLVDAGMRQLVTEGWMHNRVRMLTASFLVKDLHLHWSRGARYFMKHLVDGDISSNNHGWQWAAGTGTDAAPYFRIFNPIRQSERFDPTGNYIRRYVPELAEVTSKAIHQPWTLPDGPPNGYPPPMVDHADERQVALDRYQATRK